MYSLNIFRAIKIMTIKDLKDFTYEKYHRQLGILSILSEEKIGSKIGSKINNNYLTTKNL